MYFSRFNCRTKGLFLWRRKTFSLEIENWAQNLGKSTTHSQLICWSPLKRCTLVMVWPVLPLPAWGPCPQQLPWPQQEWVSKIIEPFWNSILGFRKRCLFVQSETHTELQSQFSNHYLKFARFLELFKSRNQSDFKQHLLWQQYKLKEGNVKPHIIFVIFSPWNSLQAKNLNYRT